MLYSQIKLIAFMLYFFLAPGSIAQYTDALQELDLASAMSQYLDPTSDDDKADDSEALEPSAEPNGMIAYLTFDDGPTASTADILDVLKDYDAKATFFMIEPQISRYPEVMLRKRDEGHGLGSHSVSHQFQVFYKSTEQMIWEMETTAQTIKEFSGVETGLIRVPFGSVPHMTKEQKDIMAEHGFKLWDWNVDSRDWQFKNGYYVEFTIEQLEKLRAKEKSPVILLHDNRNTALHLHRLLSYMKEQGYEFRAITSSVPEVQF